MKTVKNVVWAIGRNSLSGLGLTGPLRAIPNEQLTVNESQFPFGVGAYRAIVAGPKTNPERVCRNSLSGLGLTGRGRIWRVRGSDPRVAIPFRGWGLPGERVPSESPPIRPGRNSLSGLGLTGPMRTTSDTM